MHPMKVATSVIILLCLLAGNAFAEIIKIGEKVPAFTSKDQHGQSFEFKPGVRFLLIAFDMSTGKEANKSLEKKGGQFLQDKKAVFVSNIYGMPAIGRVFALPKMKRYPHRIILADDEKLLDPFPKEKDRVTVLSLDPAGTVTGIRYWDAEKQPLDDILRD